MSELRWILLGCGLVLLFSIFLWGRRSRGQAAHGDDDTHGRIDPPLAQHVPAASAHFSGSGHVAEQPVANRWQDDEWNSTVTDLPEIRFEALDAFADPLEPGLADDEMILPAEEDFSVAPVRSQQSVPASLDHGEAAAQSAPESPREPAPKPKSEKRKIIALRLSSAATEGYSGDRLRAALEAAGLAHGKYGIFHRMHGKAGSILSVASMVEPGAFDLETMDQAQFAGVTVFALLPGPVKGAQACDQLLECARYLEKTLGGELHDERGLPLTTQRIASLRDEVLDFEHLLGSATAGPGS